MKFETPKQLTDFLRENENHPKYEDLCDELAIILSLHKQLHHHDVNELLQWTLDIDPVTIKTFLDNNYSDPEELERVKEKMSPFTINSLLERAGIPPKYNDPKLEDEELKSKLMNHFIEHFTRSNGEPFIVREGCWLCPDDQEIYKKIDEQLELCNQIIQ